MDKFPQQERQSSASLETRASAVIVVRAKTVRAHGQSPLELCLRSALAEPMIDEVVIVDHGCSEDISSALRALQADRRDVKLVAVDPKQSATAAANAGAAHARGRWLLFLDAHVVLQRGAVARMAAAGGDARAPWIVGGRLTDPMGRERVSSRSGALTPWAAFALAMGSRSARVKHKRDEPAAVAAVSGALMLIPRADFERLGGFHIEFDNHAADLDLCRRAAAEGGSVLFQPAAAGVQFASDGADRGRARGLALFAARSARTPLERALAPLARPALATILALKDFVMGRPPRR